jgi:hypothetical protein
MEGGVSDPVVSFCADSGLFPHEETINKKLIKSPKKAICFLY